jgi:hypothetical protein
MDFETSSSLVPTGLDIPFLPIHPAVKLLGGCQTSLRDEQIIAAISFFPRVIVPSLQNK